MKYVKEQILEGSLTGIGFSPLNQSVEWRETNHLIVLTEFNTKK